MKKIATAMILALLGLLLVPSAASVASGITVVDKTGDGTWTNSTWEIEIYPGETKSTSVKLRNSSSSSLDVEVSIMPDSLDNGNLTFELDKSAFTMSKKSYADVILIVEASSSATPGIYVAELEIKSEIPPSPPSNGDGVSKLKLYDLRVENITEDSADILWRTSRTSTSETIYWSSPKTTVRDKSYVRNHTVHLEDLEQDTSYYFEVSSRDKYKRGAKDEGNFTTLKTTLPEIVEPEDIEPEEVELFVPPEEPERGISWELIGGIVGGLILVCAGYLLIRWRRRKV